MASPGAPAPLVRVLRLVAAERGDLGVLAVYAVAVALLTLAVPLAMQALVTNVATGLFVGPVVLLSLIVLGGLLLAGGLSLSAIGVVEILQRRVFVRTALGIGDRLLAARNEAFRGVYAPELVNRFFDVLTVQKTLAKILVDGLAAVVQGVVAAIVLGLFSPVLLLATVLVVGLFVLAVLALGHGAVRTAVAESKTKYALAGELEDLARCRASLRVHGDRAALALRTDDAAGRYLDAREAHFRVVRRQLGATFALAALANAAVLAVGGGLVLAGGLTLGQVVAAQILVALLVAALDKAVRNAESFYDLLAALDKIGVVTDLEPDREGGDALPPRPSSRGAALELRSVAFGYRSGAPVLSDLSLSLAPGERASLVGASGAGKSTVALLAAALETPDRGRIELDGLDVRSADLDLWRAAVGLAGTDREIFAGTAFENVACGRPEVTPEAARRALAVVALDDDLAALPEGLATRLTSGGGGLSGGGVQRLVLARAIAARPRLLILDEVFAGIDEALVTTILDRLFDAANGWTILNMSHDPEVVRRTDRIHVLARGDVVAAGTPDELSQDPATEFCRLFPLLSASLRRPPRPARAPRDPAPRDPAPQDPAPRNAAPRDAAPLPLDNPPRARLKARPGGAETPGSETPGSETPRSETPRP